MSYTLNANNQELDINQQKIVKQRSVGCSNFFSDSTNPFVPQINQNLSGINNQTNGQVRSNYQSSCGASRQEQYDCGPNCKHENNKCVCKDGTNNCKCDGKVRSNYQSSCGASNSNQVRSNYQSSCGSKDGYQNIVFTEYYGCSPDADHYGNCPGTHESFKSGSCCCQDNNYATSNKLFNPQETNNTQRNTPKPKESVTWY